MAEEVVVVVVEDDEDLRVLLPLMLEAGHPTRQIRLFPSADAAMIDELMWKDITHAIVDIMLPGEHNGIDLLDWLVVNHPDVKALAVTAAPPYGPLHRRIADGGYQVLDKPYSLDALNRFLP